MSGALVAPGLITIQWGWMIEEASGFLRPDVDPWIEYPITRAGAGLAVDGPDGPAIYAALGVGEWQYVGKTTRSVRSRISEHGRSAPLGRKRLYWQSLMVLPLDAAVSTIELARLERIGRDYLRPRGGSAWG
jgi:hypothetical protein